MFAGSAFHLSSIHQGADIGIRCCRCLVSVVSVGPGNTAIDQRFQSRGGMVALRSSRNRSRQPGNFRVQQHENHLIAQNPRGNSALRYPTGCLVCERVSAGLGLKREQRLRSGRSSSVFSEVQDCRQRIFLPNLRISRSESGNESLESSAIRGRHG